jgi:SPP1 gp7 family putative phage head morphogenesis protein
VQGAVMRSITTGNGMQDLVPYLQKHKGITLRRARMIAQDQTKKSFSYLSKARMEASGVLQYEWLHTSGSRHPRKLHIAMNGHIYRYDDPPVIDEKTGERGIPGQAINCACRMRPILNFGDN